MQLNSGVATILDVPMKISRFTEVLRSFPRQGDPLGFVGTWREDAVCAGLLPVYSAFDTCYAITEDADVMYVNDSWTEPQRLTNARWRHIVFAQAAARYPELAELMPIRQPGDPGCPSCRGSGVVRYGDKTYDNFICECGGLGWIPEGSTLEPV